MAMFYIFFIDVTLYEMGIKWLVYPLNVLAIITICMGYYLMKTIWSGSYLGVRSKNENSRYVIGGIIASVFLLILGAPIFSNLGSVLIVTTLSILIFLVNMALGNISRRKNDSGED